MGLHSSCHVGSSFWWLHRLQSSWALQLWRRQWHPTPVLLPGESHGWRSLVGYSPWGREESDTTEQLHFHFSLSCTGEGNGNPLQCSCLENPRDRGAWWAAISGVAHIGHDWSDLVAAVAAAVVVWGLSCPSGMWDLPGPGVEPVSPALQGSFLTTGLPRKHSLSFHISKRQCKLMSFGS